MNNTSSTNSSIILYLRRLLNDTDDANSIDIRYEDIILDYINSFLDNRNESNQNLEQNDRNESEPENLISRNENGFYSRGTGVSVYRMDIRNNNQTALLYDDLNNSLNHIYKNSDIMYCKKLEISYLSKILNTYRYIINIITNIYKNSIICGDLITDMYLLDNLVDPIITINDLRGREIYFLVDNFISEEILINTIILLSKCTLSYYFHNKNNFYINLELQNHDGEIYNLSLVIVKCKHLFLENYQSISPYFMNKKIELAISEEEYKSYLFLNKYIHNNICMVKNTWGYDYVSIVRQNNNFYLDSIENTDIHNIILNKKLIFNNDPESCALSNIKELEILFKENNLRKKDNLTISRLFMFLNTIFILSYVEKGWKFNDLKSVPFNVNDSCYICYNNYKDFKNYEKNYMYKVSLNCCTEASYGICLQCFVKNSIENHKILKSFYCCPFCKKEHIFYNENVAKKIELLRN